MQLEFHQLDRRWEHLRVRRPQRQRRLPASLPESGQQMPIVVVAAEGQANRYLAIDGRITALQQLVRDGTSPRESPGTPSTTRPAHRGSTARDSPPSIPRWCSLPWDCWPTRSRDSTRSIQMVSEYFSFWMANEGLLGSFSMFQKLSIGMKPQCGQRQRRAGSGT
jgi:hypothetical protein